MNSRSLKYKIDFAPLGLWNLLSITFHRASPCANDFRPLGAFRPTKGNLGPGITLSISPKGVSSLAQGVFFGEVKNSPGISIGLNDISPIGAKSIKFVTGTMIPPTKSI